MKTEWNNVLFTFVAYRETGISILSAVDDIQVYENCFLYRLVVIGHVLASVSFSQVKLGDAVS